MAAYTDFTAIRFITINHSKLLEFIAFSFYDISSHDINTMQNVISF